MFKAVLLDIEGTLVPTHFVENTLKPFARARMPEYIAQNYASLAAQAQTEHAADQKNNLNPPPLDAVPESLARYLEWMADTRPASALFKIVQEKICQIGFEGGSFVTPVFADVVPALKKWRDGKISIAVFSSAGVVSQKLLLTRTDQGDLSPFVAAYFDTTLGIKSDAESYRKIATAMSFPQVENLLFVSDAPAELDAARKAGLQTALSLREGNEPIEEETAHRIIQSFAEIEA